MSQDKGDLGKAAIEPDGRPKYLFTPGVALTPPHLAGRSDTLEKISEGIVKMHATPSGGRPILMYGPRGMGKTALLSEIESDPPYGADIRQTTPAVGLANINNIPALMLSGRGEWKNIVSNIHLNVPLIGLGLDMNRHETAEYMKHRIIDKCKREPMVLIVDEAHKLSSETGAFFLNYCQDIVKYSNLLLVLSGTPDTASIARRVGATYITRGQKETVGNLLCEDAKAAIKIPIREHNVSIDDDVLERVVADCQGFPHFLQIWGENLWGARTRPNMDHIGEREYQNAVEGAVKDKASLYEFYFKDIDLLEYHAPATALALEFQDRAEIDEDEVKEIISGYIDQNLNDVDGDKESARVYEHLMGHDVLWCPSDDVAEVAMPSFHPHIMQRFKKRMAARMRLHPERAMDARYSQLLDRIRENERPRGGEGR